MRYYNVQLAFDGPFRLVVKETDRNVSLGLMEMPGPGFPPIVVYVPKARKDKLERAAAAFNAIISEGEEEVTAQLAHADRSPLN